MEKHDALKILFQCADQYYENLCDNTLLIISAIYSGKKTFATEILFERTNFLHLTGVKFQKGKHLSPNTFYNLCRTRRLKKEDFELAPDGTTERKLSILPAIVGSENLGANMIGDYYDRKPVLVTEKLAGNIRGCVGVVYDARRKIYAPNTVLNLDMRSSVRNRQRILLIYQKHKKETEYAKLV